MGRAVPGRGEVHPIRRDAGAPAGDRRRRHRHARPHPRRHRRCGDAGGQARLRAEAAHLVGPRGSGAERPGRRDGGGDPDGQSGPLLGRGAARERVDPVRGHRKCPGGTRLDEPAHLEAGSAPSRPHGCRLRASHVAGSLLVARLGERAPGFGAERRLHRSPGPGVGPLRRAVRTGREVPPHLPSLPLAGVGGLRCRCPGRHGRTPHRPPLLGP